MRKSFGTPLTGGQGVIELGRGEGGGGGGDMIRGFQSVTLNLRKYTMRRRTTVRMPSGGPFPYLANLIL